MVDTALHPLFAPLRRPLVHARLTVDTVLRGQVMQVTPDKDAPEGCVRVQAVDGRTGYMPKDNLVPLAEEDLEPRDAAGDAGAGSDKGGRHRAASWKDGVLLVLYCLRTGSTKKDAAPLFRLGYSTACRYFLVYLQAIKMFLSEEFFYPREAMIKNATPSSWAKSFPGHSVQEIIDGHEQEMQVPPCTCISKCCQSLSKISVPSAAGATAGPASTSGRARPTHRLTRHRCCCCCRVHASVHRCLVV